MHKQIDSFVSSSFCPFCWSAQLTASQCELSLALAHMGMAQIELCEFLSIKIQFLPECFFKGKYSIACTRDLCHVCVVVDALKSKK